MVTDCVRKNFYWFIFWGFVLQCVGGSVTAMSHSLLLNVLGLSIYVAGMAILVVGFGFYVKSKGRSLAWFLLALISIIGWAILILLEDKESLVLKPRKP